MNELTNTKEPQIAYSECYVQPFFTFYNADNMAIMKTFKDKEFDLAIVDPPYGIGGDKGIQKNNGKFGFAKHKKTDWDNNTPNNEYFNELFRISKNQIIWGGNYFSEYLPSKMCWLCWDKMQTDFSFSDFDLIRGFDAKGKHYSLNNGRIHPTQKPTQLYEWIISNYAKDGFKILDTHLGSGSIAIAIDKANTLDKKNLTFVGIELDPDYFRAAVERFKNHKHQCVLF